MGIDSLGPRRRILAAIAQRNPCLTDCAGSAPALQAAGQSTGGAQSHPSAAGPSTSSMSGAVGRDQARQGRAGGGFGIQAAPKPGQITRYFRREGSSAADLDTPCAAPQGGGLTFNGSSAGQITRFLQRPNPNAVDPQPLSEGGRSGQGGAAAGAMRCGLAHSPSIWTLSGPMRSCVLGALSMCLSPCAQRVTHVGCLRTFDSSVCKISTG
jgi:hypothetical protein